MERARLNGNLDLLLSVLADGLLASDWSKTPGRRWRVCALTGKGAAALAAERARWRRFAAGMQAVVGWPA